MAEVRLFVLSVMIIELLNVVSRPKMVELTFTGDEIDLDISDAKLKGVANLFGEIVRVDGKAHVRGKIVAEVLIDCTRCLVPVAKEFEILFDDVFVDPADEPVEDEIILDSDSLDESIAIDGKIDLTEVVREQIILALPDQVYCTNECKGLCPKCGSNRNLINCSCIEQEIDPRWSALKNLK